MRRQLDPSQRQLNISYNIVPDIQRTKHCRKTLQEIELRPRTAITFTFRGSSAVVGPLSESLYCEARVGKEKHTRQVFQVRYPRRLPGAHGSGGTDLQTLTHKGLHGVDVRLRTGALPRATAVELRAPARAGHRFLRCECRCRRHENRSLQIVIASCSMCCAFIHAILLLNMVFSREPDGHFRECYHALKCPLIRSRDKESMMWRSFLSAFGIAGLKCIMIFLIVVPSLFMPNDIVRVIAKTPTFHTTTILMSD